MERTGLPAFTIKAFTSSASTSFLSEEMIER